jgi:hypothetical protein
VGEIAYFPRPGSYHGPFQRAPVVALPAVGAATGVAGVSDRRGAGQADRPGSTLVLGLGLVGTVFHVVGLARRYRSLDRRALLFNWLSGPPVPALSS